MTSKPPILTGCGASPPLRIHAPEPGPSDEPTCDRCMRAAGRTYPVSPGRRYCWPCFDRHLTDLAAGKGRDASIS